MIARTALILAVMHANVCWSQVYLCWRRMLWILPGKRLAKTGFIFSLLTIHRTKELSDHWGLYITNPRLQPDMLVLNRASSEMIGVLNPGSVLWFGSGRRVSSLEFRKWSHTTNIIFTFFQWPLADFTLSWGGNGTPNFSELTGKTVIAWKPAAKTST